MVNLKPLRILMALAAAFIFVQASMGSYDLDTTSVQAIGTPDLQWSECWGYVAPDDRKAEQILPECTSILVPMDWERPRANRRIAIALARIPATDPSARVGTLMFNPGGPMPAIDNIGKFSATLNKHFDIVTMDPRGLGESTPIGDVLRDRFATTKLPLTDDEYEDIVDFNRDMAQKSLDMNGDIIKHVDTVSIARDMEAVRLALGEPQLTFFGFSYGTQLGATYAELFPTRFRAMVFDGVHDHTAGSLEMALRYHSAHQDAFDRFAAWCDSSFACVLHGHDLHRSLDRALEIVGDGAVCLSDWITLMLVEGWFTGAADALASVLGKSSFIGFLIGLFVTLATEPPGRPNWSFMPMTADTMCQMFPESIPADYIAIHCGDGPSTSPNVSELNALQHSIEAVAPSMRKGGAFKDRVSSCLGWPFPPKNPPHRLQLPLDIPPILIVNSLYDYRTPYASAVNIQSQVPGSVLLTTRSEGHCSYNKWGSEASGIIEEYLINGTLPAPGTIVDS